MVALTLNLFAVLLKLPHLTEQWLGIQTDNAREQQSQRFPVIEK